MKQQPKGITEIKNRLRFYQLLKFIQRIPFRFSVLLRLIWILFPSFFFVAATFFCFWNLSQGKDVLIAVLERGWTKGLILLSILFYSLVTWYSSRVLVYGKPQLYKDSKLLAFHVPRILGFSIYTILIIGMLKIPPIQEQHFSFRISEGAAKVLLLISIAIIYPVLYLLFRKLRKDILYKVSLTGTKTLKEAAAEKKRFKIIYTILGALVAIILYCNFLPFSKSTGWFFWSSLIALQLIFLFIVVIRRGRLPGDNSDPAMPLYHKTFKNWQRYLAENDHSIITNFWQKLLFYSNISSQEKWFFKLYNSIAALSVLIYLLVIYRYNFAVTLGSLGTIMLAFGVLVGIFSFVSFFSIIYRINFHVILLLLALLIGGRFEPHYVNIIKNSSANYQHTHSNRPELKEYFINWLQNRKAALDTVKTEYPVFFVLADGGASRSGYWTATVLGTLQDSSKGEFANHLFCLSGASGGSVGNGTFMALLKNKELLPLHANKNYKNGAASFLKNDFLSYTLARMLGPDFIRPILSFIPINKMGDRAEALEHAMENAGSVDSTFLYNRLKAPFADFIPVNNRNDQLPVFCINCTRMQDGRPSVIANIKLKDSIFGKRIDILNDLDSGQDLKLSTAVILGARFPYISPAGRIKNSYYVDGGYFDNSGSGFVLEMITELRKLQNDPSIMSITANIKKLGFYIIHIQNGESGNVTPKKIHPLLNDLAAPIRTLLGAYGTQTSVNDWRLEKYMAEIKSPYTNTAYFKINLHADKDSADSYPMNWAISQYYINKMDNQLNNKQMKALFAFFKTNFGWPLH